MNPTINAILIGSLILCCIQNGYAQIQRYDVIEINEDFTSELWDSVKVWASDQKTDVKPEDEVRAFNFKRVWNNKQEIDWSASILDIIFSDKPKNFPLGSLPEELRNKIDSYSKESIEKKKIERRFSPNPLGLKSLSNSEKCKYLVNALTLPDFFSTLNEIIEFHISPKGVEFDRIDLSLYFNHEKGILEFSSLNYLTKGMKPDNSTVRIQIADWVGSCISLENSSKYLPLYYSIDYTDMDTAFFFNPLQLNAYLWDKGAIYDDDTIELSLAPIQLEGEMSESLLPMHTVWKREMSMIDFERENSEPNFSNPLHSTSFSANDSVSWFTGSLDEQNPTSKSKVNNPEIVLRNPGVYNFTAQDTAFGDSIGVERRGNLIVLPDNEITTCLGSLNQTVADIDYEHFIYIQTDSITGEKSAIDTSRFVLSDNVAVQIERSSEDIISVNIQNTEADNFWLTHNYYCHEWEDSGHKRILNLPQPVKDIMEIENARRVEIKVLNPDSVIAEIQERPNNDQNLGEITFPETGERFSCVLAYFRYVDMMGKPLQPEIGVPVGNQNWHRVIILPEEVKQFGKKGMLVLEGENNRLKEENEDLSKQNEVNQRVVIAGSVLTIILSILLI